MIRTVFTLFAMVASSLGGLTAATSASSADEPSAKQSPAAKPVRVMSFNIRFGTAPDGENVWNNRKEFVAETIDAFDPDLLGTQETLPSQRDFLAGKLSGYEGFAAGRDDGKEKGEMTAVFFRRSRFEKLDGGHFWLSTTPGKPASKGWDAALPRIATWVKLKDRTAPKSKPVLFLNTHFDHRGREARAESARLVRKKLGELGKGCRLIVTGDFNAPEGSGPYKALFDDVEDRPELIDTFRAAHPKRKKNEGTFSAFRGNTAGGRIDWIACSTDWEVRLAGIDRTAKDGRNPSDHFPVTAVLRPASSTRTLRVLCYNIHHGRGTDGKVDLPRLAKVIRDADPDLVALQEVDKNTKRTGGVDQTAELARLTGLHGEFGKQIDYEGGEYGQAVLSRFPIQPRAIHLLPGEPDREQRIAFEVQFTLDGETLSFAGTHLHHQSDPFRRKQTAKINEVLGNVDRPVILAGDLNALPDSKPLEILAEKWTVATSNPELLTFPADKPTKQIDYILHRPAGRFKVRKTSVLEEPVASDHRPVLAVFEWKPKSKGE